MTEEDWTNSYTRCLGLRLSGDALEEVDARGEPIVDDTFLILLNAHHEPARFILPAHRRGIRWEAVLDTHEGQARHRQPLVRGGQAYELDGRPWPSSGCGRSGARPSVFRGLRDPWTSTRPNRRGGSRPKVALFQGLRGP